MWSRAHYNKVSLVEVEKRTKECIRSILFIRSWCKLLCNILWIFLKLNSIKKNNPLHLRWTERLTRILNRKIPKKWPIEWTKCKQAIAQSIKNSSAKYKRDELKSKWEFVLERKFFRNNERRKKEAWNSFTFSKKWKQHE